MGETVEDQIIEMREHMSAMMEVVKEIESRTTPPVVQEVVLARRALEDARMRLGVALTIVNGKDPWNS